MTEARPETGPRPDFTESAITENAMEDPELVGEGNPFEGTGVPQRPDDDRMARVIIPASTVIIVMASQL